MGHVASEGSLRVGRRDTWSGLPERKIGLPFGEKAGVFVGRLHQIGNLTIRIYANDHLPPHFHAVAPDFEAVIEIETLFILKGSLPRPARDAVIEWSRNNKAAIVAEWNRTNPRFPIA